MANMFKRTKRDPRIVPKKKTLASRIEGLKRSFRRNSRKNPWKQNKKRKSVPWAKIMAPLLIVMIPVAVMYAGDNILLRTTALYSFHLNSTEILSEEMVYAENEDVVGLFGDYMMGKTDEFRMKENLEYMPEELFNEIDALTVKNIRYNLDKEAYAAGVILLLVIGIYIYLYRKKEKDLLLRNYFYSIVGFAVLAIFDTLTVAVKPLRQAIHGDLSSFNFPKDDLLVKILDTSFMWRYSLFSILVAAIMMGIGLYITLAVAGKHHMFRR